VRKKLAFAAVAALGVVLGGAVSRHLLPRPAAEPVERWTAEHSRALEESVELLEERLLAHQARVSFWSELQARHAQISAVACANLGEHAVALQVAESRARARGAEQKRRRLASAGPLVAE
jgi:hypothetical protein